MKQLGKVLNIQIVSFFYGFDCYVACRDKDSGYKLFDLYECLNISKYEYSVLVKPYKMIEYKGFTYFPTLESLQYFLKIEAIKRILFLK